MSLNRCKLHNSKASKAILWPFMFIYMCVCVCETEKLIHDQLPIIKQEKYYNLVPCVNKKEK